MSGKKGGIKVKKIAKKKPITKLDNSGLKEDQKRFCKILWEAMKLRWRKLNDYGTSYQKFGSLGVVIRLSDKISRLERLIKGQKAKVTDENMKDTCLDIINYATMAIMLLDQGE